MDSEIERYRNFLKENVRLEIDFSKTDQNRNIPPPPFEKPYPKNRKLIPLPGTNEWKSIKGVDLLTAIKNRKSHREYKPAPLNLEELSFLLWATQGIRKVINPGRAFRTVPSAGCRHAFETYLCVLNVQGLEPGIYRYSALENCLILEFYEEELSKKIVEATLGQSFIGTAAATFIWTAVPYRMEWRYGRAAHRTIAIDGGHVCQNLYLACEAIDAGCCAVGAYNQGLMDRLLRVDGKDEFTIYLASVGKV